MYQLSTNYSVNESSSLFTLSFSEISGEENVIVVTCRNSSQEEFIRKSLRESTYLVRKTRYDRETGETIPEGDWTPVRREAFKFLDRQNQEIRGFSTASILEKFAASPKRRSR